MPIIPNHIFRKEMEAMKKPRIKEYSRTDRISNDDPYHDNVIAPMQTQAFNRKWEVNHAN